MKQRGLDSEIALFVIVTFGQRFLRLARQQTSYSVEKWLFFVTTNELQPKTKLHCLDVSIDILKQNWYCLGWILTCKVLFQHLKLSNMLWFACRWINKTNRYCIFHLLHQQVLLVAMALIFVCNFSNLPYAGVLKITAHWHFYLQAFYFRWEDRSEIGKRAYFPFCCVFIGHPGKRHQNEKFPKESRELRWAPQIWKGEGTELFWCVIKVPGLRKKAQI